MIKKVFGIFRVKREERQLALFMLLLLVAVNALVVCCYFDALTSFSDASVRTLTRIFHVSGFDPISYAVLTKWSTAYNIYRHPLLPFFMYVPYLVNQALWAVTGVNCAIFIMAAIQIFCSFYAFLFVFRTLREVIGLGRGDATLLSLLGWSSGYMLVSSVVPDHFILSVFILALTLYVSGKMIQRGRGLSVWQTVLFFILSAGISLNNGIKIFMANFFTRGKRFFRPCNLIFSIILPALLIWMFARWEYYHYEWPKWQARQELKAKHTQRTHERIEKNFRDTTSLKDEAAIQAGVRRAIRKNAWDKYVRDHKKASVAHKGKAIKKGEFWDWTDISTSRSWTFVENLFGEPVLLHENYLLGDTLVSRPVIVHYRWWLNYAVEALVILLLIAGVWCGRRQRLMWLALCFFLYDMALHMGIGFAINEIYIMSAHWLFLFPVIMAYFLKACQGKRLLGRARLLVAVLTAYLFVWNITLMVEYFCFL